ncbi:hypothetical protein [Sedimenticola sp.]|uniref:hypothetical protein n=1 Tax=Sedimenticola sp. TaxID=1940285 RepID=UPI003D0A42F1
MDNQVQVTLDKAVHDRLVALQTGSFHDINAVVERLLFHGDRKVLLDAAEPHYTMEQEIQRERDGVFASSGVSS